MPKELQKTNILATQNTSFLYLLDQKAIKNELQTSNHCVNQLRQQKKKKIKVVTVSSLWKIYVKQRERIISPLNLVKWMAF